MALINAGSTEPDPELLQRITNYNNADWASGPYGGHSTNYGPPPPSTDEIIPPNSRPINPTRQVGPFTGGTSTEGSYWDPRSWFKADPRLTFKPGEPIPTGGFNPFGKGGFWPTLTYSTLYPTPAETGEFTPAEPNMVRPDAPMSSVHGLPKPAAPTPYIAMPWRGPIADQPSAAAPVQPARPVTPAAAAPAAAPAASPFIGFERQNLSATGWNPGTRMGTALDLSGLFGGRPAATNPADVPASSAKPMSGGALSKGGIKLPKDWGPFTEDQARGRSLKQRYG